MKKLTKKQQDLAEFAVKTMKLCDLKEGDVFYTFHYYSLKNTPEKCNAFVCIRHYVDKNDVCRTKCIAINYRKPDAKYFKSDLEIYQLQKHD